MDIVGWATSVVVVVMLLFIYFSFLYPLLDISIASTWEKNLQTWDWNTNERFLDEFFDRKSFSRDKSLESLQDPIFSQPNRCTADWRHFTGDTWNFSSFLGSMNHKLKSGRKRDRNSALFSFKTLKHRKLRIRKVFACHFILLVISFLSCITSYCIIFLFLISYCKVFALYTGLILCSLPWNRLHWKKCEKKREIFLNRRPVNHGKM